LDEGKVSVQIITERLAKTTLRKDLKLDVLGARVEFFDGVDKVLFPSAVHRFIDVQISPIFDKVAVVGGLGYLNIVHSGISVLNYFGWHCLGQE